jgi:hypothetical protein
VTPHLPKIAFSRLAAPAAPGNIQFYDGYFPALPANTYQISVKHEVSGAPDSVPVYNAPQSAIVQAPEFTIDPAIVQTVYPPNGATDIYDQELSFLVLTDPALPWERALIPDQPPSPGEPTPWLALVLFADGEMLLPPNSHDPVSTCTVAQFLADDANVLKPVLPSGWVSAEMLSSQCQTITIPGAIFNAMMPQKGELRYLAHCRGVNVPDEDQVLLSVLLANRLPLAKTDVAPAQPMRYHAHLISLEGFAGYLGASNAIPLKSDQSGLKDVQLVSLFNWTFSSLPEPGLSFEQLVTGLIQSETETPALRLPVPSNANTPKAVIDRLNDGCVALKFVAGSGEESFAWYRGPFTPVVPQALPEVGDARVPIAQASSADELMIYLAEQGLFDLSYAAAWNIGRGLALEDASFALAMYKYNLRAKNAVATLSQRLAMPHLAAVQDPRKLLARDANRRQFVQLVGEGLGQRWTEALSRARNGTRPASNKRSARARPRARIVQPRHVLAHPEVASALGEHLEESTNPVAAWLANLSLLYPVPFSYFVPDPRMLPVESIRFFYVDPSWIDALVAGAISIAVKTSADAAAIAAVHPRIRQAVALHVQRQFVRPAPVAAAVSGAANATAMTGMLIRSQLISGWPALVVSATAGGAPVTIVRNDRPSPNVRLCLFQGVPDTVNLAEPYQGLRFGIEDNGVAPRYVTSDGQTGAQMSGVKTKTVPADGYSGFLQKYCRTPVGGIITVATLAGDLATATGASPDKFGAGDFAIQMVQAPELQSFPTR